MPRRDDALLARFLDAVAGVLPVAAVGSVPDWVAGSVPDLAAGSVPDLVVDRVVDDLGPRLRAGALTGVLLLLYAAFVVGLCFPVLVGTGGALYYLDHLLGLEGAVRTAYFALGVVVVMAEFTLLRRVVDAVGDRLFGEMRDPAWKQ